MSVARDAGHTPLTRRAFCERALCDTAAVGAAALLAACRTPPASDTAVASDRGAIGSHATEGRLAARPRTPTRIAAPGVHALGLDEGHDALLYVPEGHGADRPAPLVLVLHGAGGSATRGLALLRDLADDAGLVLLAPASRQRTWDVVLGGFGPDVALVDAALDATFQRCAVDRRRLAVSGFSDGASYALSLGLANGDLFTHVVAFSPGFVASGRRVGRPRCYVSHGTRDAVLPIDRCSRRIVPMLQRTGYAVRYREFDGPHAVPPDVAREAVDWLAATPG